MNQCALFRGNGVGGKFKWGLLDHVRFYVENAITTEGKILKCSTQSVTIQEMKGNIAELLIKELLKILTSGNDCVTFNSTVTVMLERVKAMGAGMGGRNPNQKYDDFVRRKKCVVRINNQDWLSMARAIVVCLANLKCIVAKRLEEEAKMALDNGDPSNRDLQVAFEERKRECEKANKNYDSAKRKKTVQKKMAEDLLARCNVPQRPNDGNCYDDLKTIAETLKLCILVYPYESLGRRDFSQTRCFNELPSNERSRERTIALVYTHDNGGHYDAVVNGYGRLWGDNYRGWCCLCYKPTLKGRTHNCIEQKCRHCYSLESRCDSSNEANHLAKPIVCEECHFALKTTRCYENHKETGKCGMVMKCLGCAKRVDRRNAKSHRCFHEKCSFCKALYDTRNPHTCYMTRVKRASKPVENVVYVAFARDLLGSLVGVAKVCVMESREGAEPHYTSLSLAARPTSCKGTMSPSSKGISENVL